MSVVLAACFPQDRVLFLGALALWGGASALAATLLHNFAAYAAALAGYTAARFRDRLVDDRVNGLALLVPDSASRVPRRGSKRLRVPDWLPALVNAGRAFAAIGAVALPALPSRCCRFDYCRHCRRRTARAGSWR
jgi:hypothetical protein